VLLGFRSPHRQTYPGVWDAIGGHANDGESVADALVREVYEEIQVKPTEFAHLATLDEPRPEINGKVIYHVFIVTAWDGNEPVACGDEHSAISWFPVGDAARLPLAHPGYRGLLEQLAGSLPD
jgi:ADP-ribose pyrophosphatase YjhB (NUDIX family)